VIEQDYEAIDFIVSYYYNKNDKDKAAFYYKKK
jgi:hypothetical protein